MTIAATIKKLVDPTDEVTALEARTSNCAAALTVAGQEQADASRLPHDCERADASAPPPSPVRSSRPAPPPKASRRLVVSPSCARRRRRQVSAPMPLRIAASWRCLN